MAGDGPSPGWPAGEGQGWQEAEQNPTRLPPTPLPMRGFASGRIHATDRLGTMHLAPALTGSWESGHPARVSCSEAPKVPSGRPAVLWSKGLQEPPNKWQHSPRPPTGSQCHWDDAV